MVKFRPLGLWNDTWRVYALGVLSVCFAVSVICSSIFFWPFPEPKHALAAMAITAGAVFALFAALCAGLAYRAIGADLHPLLRLLGLSLVNASIPVGLILFLLGEPIPQLFQVAVPLIALHAGWSGFFLIGRRPRPPRQPLPQPLPHGWDSRH